VKNCVIAKVGCRLSNDRTDEDTSNVRTRAGFFFGENSVHTKSIEQSRDAVKCVRRSSTE
jgi:hypothetical protein